MPLSPHSTATTASMRWLPGLLLATFVIGTDDFIIAGILPELAVDFDVTEAAAGQLVTVFSLVYAVAAPVMALLTARLSRRKLIVGGLTVFALVNAATVFAPSYAALMALRVAAALVGATITPAAFATAGSLAPPERSGRAIGVVAAGLTVSLIVGVPVGSWLGELFGWQSTFALVATLTGAAVIITGTTLPAIPGPPATGLRERLTLLRRPSVLSCVVGTVIGATAGFMPYTFIAPVVTDLTGVERTLIPVTIGVIGVAGAIGTVAGGRLNDRWGPDRTILTLMAVMATTTVLLALAGPLFGGNAPYWLLLTVLAVWGAAVWAYNPPMNARALRLAAEAGTEAVALNTSGLYIGIAVAGALGGAALTTGNGALLLAVSGTVVILGLVFMTWAIRRFPSSAPLNQ
ncbi:Arabinose transporter, MFS-type [Corynebacterium glyciniphilum AJ 3170]|uniref:Arabinose transporter, MFS-type n=1 Tax=Corynebacterium glyciniphilum AJ 3170 TaxID=1404245 RepID=X5DUR9_9CORY|nr:MFS transporter [Corynebacterium glyciniphilum]AHW65039.1 Arabinose transporter, MFS-type [Corynebacterium glyciniphilum AJ 3170]